MKILIVPSDRVDKLKFPQFDGFDTIEPQQGSLDGKDVWFLPETLKYIKKFSKVLVDLEVCELKEIETIKPVSYDSKGLVTTNLNKAVTTKTILTEKIISITK